MSISETDTTITISIHIPRVGDDAPFLRHVVHKQAISIHIPRVGDDEKISVRLSKYRRFQSTSPVWGMTPVRMYRAEIFQISIHIPRVGDDYLLT